VSALPTVIGSEIASPRRSRPTAVRVRRPPHCVRRAHARGQNGRRQSRQTTCCRRRRHIIVQSRSSCVWQSRRTRPPATEVCRSSGGRPMFSKNSGHYDLVERSKMSESTTQHCLSARLHIYMSPSLPGCGFNTIFSPLASKSPFKYVFQLLDWYLYLPNNKLFIIHNYWFPWALYDFYMILHF